MNILYNQTHRQPKHSPPALREKMRGRRRGVSSLPDEQTRKFGDPNDPERPGPGRLSALSVFRFP